MPGGRCPRLGLPRMKKSDESALVAALYELVQALTRQVDELAERVRVLELRSANGRYSGEGRG